VKTIRNPEKPLYGEVTFELEEDLILGSGEDEVAAFYGIIKIEVDSGRNIYVLKAAECQILKFDKYGDLVATIGGEGQGPGEFENPSELQLDSEENLYVKDMFKLHVFDSEGKFINKLPLNVRPWIWKKGKLYTLEEDEEGYHLVKRYKVNWNIKQRE
jgi:hypothetical protein